MGRDNRSPGSRRGAAHLAERAENQGQRGHGGGVRPEDSGAERRRLPPGFEGLAPLRLGPPPLRTDEDGGFGGPLMGQNVPYRAGRGRGNKDDTDAPEPGAGRRDPGEGDGIEDLRDEESAGLLGGRHGDAAPPREARPLPGGRADRAALGDDREDGGDADLDALLDDEIHAIAVGNRLRQRHLRGGFHTAVLRPLDRDGGTALPEGADPSDVASPAAVEDRDLVAHAEPQDAAEMVQLVAADHPLPFGEVGGIDEEAALTHGAIRRRGRPSRPARSRVPPPGRPPPRPRRSRRSPRAGFPRG